MLSMLAVLLGCLVPCVLVIVALLFMLSDAYGQLEQVAKTARMSRHALQRIQEDWAAKGPREREEKAVLEEIAACCREALGEPATWEAATATVGDLLEKLDALRP